MLETQGSVEKEHEWVNHEVHEEEHEEEQEKGQDLLTRRRGGRRGEKKFNHGLRIVTAAGGRRRARPALQACGMFVRFYEIAGGPRPTLPDARSSRA